MRIKEINDKMPICPVCGARLKRGELTQFDTPIGYRLDCRHCGEYTDIWVNGLRELHCGSWSSGAFESGFGAMSRAEQRWEKRMLLIFEARLLLARLQYRLKTLRHTMAHNKPWPPFLQER